MSRSRLLAFLVFIMTIVIVFYPEVAFTASLDGLKLWFEVVLPALLPFFIMADLMMGLGVVHFIGSLLEPIMRPLFRIPGVGGFAVAMGLAGGYPLGAKITGELERQKAITTVEAERLVSFANTADPLFIVGAVAVGMFERVECGLILVLAHYISAFLVGFFMRLHKGAESPVHKSEGGYFPRALQALDEAKKADGRSLGQLFGDTVQETFQSMLFIGGCIMIFSVFVKVFYATGFMAPIQGLVGRLLAFLGLPASLSPAILTGFFETTLGAETASRSLAPLGAQLTIASLAMGWSGLSVHGQVAALLTGTKIRLGPYLLARTLHGLLAAILTALLWGPMQFLPVSFLKALPVLGKAEYLNGSFMARLLASTRLATSLTLFLTLLLIIIWFIKRVIYISFRTRL